MDNRKQPRKRSLYRAAIGTIAALALSACGSMTYEELRTAQTVPAATGKVGYDRTEDGNMKLAIDVDHLAPAQQVEPGSNVYVVWGHPAGGVESAHNLGVLNIGEDRSGSLHTTTAARELRLTITPEPTASTSQPSNEPVMTALIRPSE